jgi:hypothetical protein
LPKEIVAIGGKPCSATRQRSSLAALLSLTGGATLSATAPLPLSFSSPPPARVHPAAPARARLMGRSPGRPARTPCRHARAGVGTSWKGDFTHLPLRRALLMLGLRGGGGCQLGRPGGQTGGRTGLSRRLSRRRVTNPAGEGGSKRQVPKPPTPLGFSFPSSPVCVP